MHVHVQVHRSPNGLPQHITLTQTLTLVLRSSDESYVRPASYQNWDLSSMFGVPLRGACRLARHSRVYVELPETLSTNADHLDALLSLPSHKKSARDSRSATEYCSSGGEQVDSNGEVGSCAAADSQNDSEGMGRNSMGANSSESNHGTIADQGSHSTQQDRVLLPARPASWKTPLFTLSPMPDAVVIGSVCSDTQTGALLERDHTTQGGHGWSCTGESVKTSDSMSSHSKASMRDVLYMYDLQLLQKQLPQSSAGADYIDFSQVWHTDSGAAGLRHTQPLFAVHRHVTGTGNMHGGTVLQLARGDRTATGTAAATAAEPGSSHAAAPAAPSAGAADGNHTTPLLPVCIYQVVPWYIRLWCHTLKLKLNGQVGWCTATAYGYCYCELALVHPCWMPGQCFGLLS